MLLGILIVCVCGTECFDLIKPILRPKVNDALLNSSLELTCHTSHDQNNTQWGTRKRADTFSLVSYSKEGACDTSGFLADSQYFETSCYSNGTFKTTLKHVNISNHGQEWYCSHGYASSNTAHISVRGPATSVNIEVHSKKNIYMKENEIQTISCKTSACFPKPAVKWFLRSTVSNMTNELTNRSTHVHIKYIQQPNGLIEAESILELLTNRTLNNWHLYCEVWTWSKNYDISSKELSLNVAYPPDNPPFIVGYDEDNVIQVVELEMVELNCTVTGGNPLPSLKMNCSDSDVSTTIITHTMVTVKIKWKAFRNDSKCTCESNHILAGTHITIVRVDVFFSPIDVHFTEIGLTSEENTYVVNRDKEVIFECFAESNPYPDITIQFKGYDLPTTKKNETCIQHYIDEVSCFDAGEYTCSARNMISIGQGVISKLILIVKCPPQPSSDSLRDTKIASQLYTDVTLQFVAEDYFEKQNKTVFTWYNEKASIQNGGNKYIISSFGLQSNLSIRNITLSDYGQYRILVRNSAGHFIHFYELQEIEKQSTDSIRSSTFIVVAAVSTFIFTILTGGTTFLCCRHIRRNRAIGSDSRNTAHNIYEEETPFDYEEINTVNVYEQLAENSTDGR